MDVYISTTGHMKMNIQTFDVSGPLTGPELELITLSSVGIN